MRVPEIVRQVLLVNPVIRIIVGVQIALAPFLGIGIRVDILELPGEAVALSLPHICHCRIQGDVAGVGFWGGCHENRRIAQGDPGFGHTQLQRHVHTGIDDGDDLREGKSHILRRDDHEPPTGGLHLPRLQKPRQVMTGRIGIGAPDGFLQGGQKIVIVVAVPVGTEGAFLGDGFGIGQCQRQFLSIGNPCRKQNLDRIDGLPQVAAHGSRDIFKGTIFEFKQIDAPAALKAVKRAVSFMEERTGLTAAPENGALEYIAGAVGGDLRKAINAVEVLFSAGIPNGDKLPLTLQDAKAVTQKSALRADRDGDNYYDLLSALQKSIRGSDPDAACHYLARLLEAGQMQSACRRLMVIAAEDVGLAFPQIITIVNSCVDMALKLGMPEARIPLGDAAILMATSPKSNTGHIALDAALADVRKGKGQGFPRQLQNVHADTYTQEREQGYLYPHDYPGHWVRQQYLPDDIKNAKYYEYGPNQLEQAARAYWDQIKGGK